MRLRDMLLGLVTITYMVTLPAQGFGAVIYNNGGPLLLPVIAQGASFADTGSAFSEAADDFSLATGSSTIRDIHWWGTYGTLTPDVFTIRIYNNNAGTVGSLVATANVTSLQRTATGQTISDRAMYAYDAVISDIALAPLTTYWLGISNNTGNSGNSGWAWVNSANSGGNAKQLNASSGLWGNTSGKGLAFNLTDTLVPEPSSVVLATIGLVGISAYAWRRKKKCAC